MEVSAKISTKVSAKVSTKVSTKVGAKIGTKVSACLANSGQGTQVKPPASSDARKPGLAG